MPNNIRGKDRTITPSFNIWNGRQEDGSIKTVKNFPTTLDERSAFYEGFSRLAADEFIISLISICNLIASSSDKGVLLPIGTQKDMALLSSADLFSKKGLLQYLKNDTANIKGCNQKELAVGKFIEDILDNYYEREPKIKFSDNVTATVHKLFDSNLQMRTSIKAVKDELENELARIKPIVAINANSKQDDKHLESTNRVRRRSSNLTPEQAEKTTNSLKQSGIMQSRKPSI